MHAYMAFFSWTQIEWLPTLDPTCEPTDPPVSMEIKDLKSSGLPGMYIDDSMGARGAQLPS